MFKSVVKAVYLTTRTTLTLNVLKAFYLDMEWIEIQINLLY